MTLPPSPISRRIAAPFAVLLTLVALAIAGPATALATSPGCASHPHTLAAKNGGKVWRSGSSLFGCTTAYGPSFGHAPRSSKLGPWAPGTKVAFDGLTAVWTLPKPAGDRVWADDLESGKRWLTGTRIVPGSAGQHFSEGRVQRLLLTDQAAAWITTDGQAVLALHDPAGETPSPVGALAAPLSANKQLLLVGNYPDVGASFLAAGAKLEIVDGDGDECGGVDSYRLTVQPDPAGPRLGATWDGYWEVRHCG